MSSFHTLQELRHSGREFDPSKTISDAHLQALMQAAHLSPSCYNDQPWSFLFCDKFKHPKSYEMLFETLVEFNQGWAKNAPLLIAVVADTLFAKNLKPNRWGPYDTGAAAMSMMYEATALGLMAHQMGGFDEKKLQSSFKIPERYTPMAVMAIGYEAKGATPLVRQRNHIPHQFLEADWNRP